MVSMPSVREASWHSRRSSLRSSEIKCVTDRTMRSNFHTTSESPFRRKSSAAFNSSRCLLASGTALREDPFATLLLERKDLIRRILVGRGDPGVAQEHVPKSTLADMLSPTSVALRSLI